ncbi:phosphopantetheine-binding protein [Nocardioides daeguensis]|uniref:Carrier domain-containing protein n=1 Tax=Nocardioides daeguensis TaxID=908359 RepID=A0ABP6VCU5_9ACTN|nr:acyl carrier protein [Nocardioides daeguensis]MBV6726207.1 acyl carrier protein [Nocardioides daeguensis]MCR1772050.1 acyl carrier protein [Nocardioides daeguensis]
MNDIESRIVTIVTELLERSDREDKTVSLGATLHGEDGLGLDSLETAELSAILEDEFGTDPFGAGLLPETVTDIVAFYADATAASA